MWRIIFLSIFLFAASQGFAQNVTNDSTKTGTYYFKDSDTIAIKGYYKNTKRHKIWNWYNADGTLHKQIKYKNGQQLWTIYFEINKPWLKIDRYGKRRIIRACKCREEG